MLNSASPDDSALAAASSAGEMRAPALVNTLPQMLCALYVLNVPGFHEPIRENVSRSRTSRWVSAIDAARVSKSSSSCW